MWTPEQARIGPWSRGAGRVGRCGGSASRAVAAAAALICLLGTTLASGVLGSGAPGPWTLGGGRGDAVRDAADTRCAPAWVTGWQAAAQPVTAASGATPTTLRLIVTPRVTGSEIRVRLSNAHGTAPLAVGTVTAARSDGNAGLVPGTERQVRFGGRSGVVLPAGTDRVSDPVPLVAEAGRPLAVSLFLPAPPPTLTGHAVALRTSYLSRGGDVALDTDGAAFDTPIGSWLVLTGVDVRAPRPVHAVVLVGDSITDGVGSGPDADERWSDALARRLDDLGGPATMAVLNAGISRNRLLGGDGGDRPAVRFDRDVAAAAGATDVVLHIGTNDIAAGHSVDEVVVGLREFARRARAGGLRVFLTTITPSHTGAHGTPAAIATRDAVNAWVRTRGAAHADGVFDLAAVVTDPASPARLAPRFDSGDGLHLSAAGHRALAAAVDPGQLTGSPCLADDPPARIVVSGG